MFDHYTLVIWITKNIRCIKTVIFVIVCEIRATIYVLTGVLVCTKNEVILILISLNGCLVWLFKFCHAKWFIYGGVERQRYVCVCLLCCNLWFSIVTNYKDTCTVIICIPMFWNNYQYHLLGSSSPRNVGIYQSILRYMPEE